MKSVVDREAVKTLAIAVGVREAARQLGLNENRVLKWSERGAWFKVPPQPPKQGDVITVIKPSEAMRNSLEDDNKQTKVGLSRATRSAAETFKTMNGTAVIENSRQLKDIVGAASQIHNWEQQEEGSGVMSGLRVYSKQTVIQVNQKHGETREVDREGQPDANRVSE